MLARVSALETFRRWREDEDQTMGDLIASLTSDEPTESMLAGTAFHAGLEAAEEGESGVMVVGGYRFNLNIDVEIALPKQREIRASKVYGLLSVTGKFDAMDGKTTIDHKTTAHFDAERYITGYQWRYYLDIFEADTFRWNVFEMKEAAPKVYDVFAFHQIEQRRYPGMHEDCARLANDFYQTLRDVLPNYQSRLEAA